MKKSVSTWFRVCIALIKLLPAQTSPQHLTNSYKGPFNWADPIIYDDEGSIYKTIKVTTFCCLFNICNISLVNTYSCPKQSLKKNQLKVTTSICVFSTFKSQKISKQFSLLVVMGNYVLVVQNEDER